MAKKTMSWSKCQIEIGKTGENDVMATSLKSVGVIKDKSSTLEASEGEALEAKATGGELRIDNLEKLLNNIMSDIENDEYLFVKDGTPKSFPVEGIAQHYINLRLHYRRKTF